MYDGAKTRVRALKVDSEQFSSMMELHYGSTLSLFLFASVIDELARYIQWRCHGNKTVSIFETTIRILGGLISAHLIASDYNTGMRIPSYDDELLHLAEDLAWRMLPAFDTPTDEDSLQPCDWKATAGLELVTLDLWCNMKGKHHSANASVQLSTEYTSEGLTLLGKNVLVPEEMILRGNPNLVVESGVTNVVSYHECRHTGAGFCLRLTTFVIGRHKYGHELKNSKYNERYARLKLTIPISFSRIQSGSDIVLVAIAKD
ncbi:putative alpha-mannosidase I MNS4 [Capsicum baccatum]|uniref:Alpha-mannosidase I MNS4 n=1 Tax=Capsicum baccatum TaxID=33114 RepID=A0A2G2WJJ2_CAPBA|nr:putative alpha-mannosidase I MNS4 [Capsicum baccatum]